MLKPPDLMHSDDDPTDEQLAELMHAVGDTVRAKRAQAAKIHEQRLAEAIASAGTKIRLGHLRQER